MRLRAHGIACELLGPAALAAAEPLLRPGLAGALKVSGDSVVYAPNAAEWLLAHAPPHPRRAGRGHAHRGPHRAPWPMAAPAARAPYCWPPASGPAPVPRPAHPPQEGHLAITERHPGLLRHQLVELGYITSAHHSDGTSVAFNLQPRPTGQLLLGSSRQFDTTDPAVENAILARMLHRARSTTRPPWPIFPSSWTGFRAATPRQPAPHRRAPRPRTACGWP